jgi:hypothetical protein
VAGLAGFAALLVFAMSFDSPGAASPGQWGDRVLLVPIWLAFVTPCALGWRARRHGRTGMARRCAAAQLALALLALVMAYRI